LEITETIDLRNIIQIKRIRTLIEIKNNDEKELKNIDFAYLQDNAVDFNDMGKNNSASNLNIYEIWKIHDDDFIQTFDENNYKVSKYACNLNNISEVLAGVLPPTDSRLRPDQRALENQNLGLAEQEKKRIEEKQRKRHKIFEENKIKYEPKYFYEVLDPLANENVYLYKGDYWKDRNEGKFEDVYQIFLD